MNRKLQEERAKAHETLKYAKQQQTKNFNLSDLKADSTQYFDSPYKPSRKSPFKPSEISARSTMNQKNQMAFSDTEFDQLMKTSSSEAVQAKYRESMAPGRLTMTTKTSWKTSADIDISPRSSMSSTVSNSGGGKRDFWDANVVASSFAGPNMSMASSLFRSGADMLDKISQDQDEQQQEYATIPPVNRTYSNESAWQERSSRAPEMSFGPICQKFCGSNNIRDVYGNQSPRKKHRVPLVEVTQVESPNNSSRIETHSQKGSKNCETIKTQEAIKFIQKSMANFYDPPTRDKTTDPILHGLGSIMGSMNIDQIFEQSQREADQLRSAEGNKSSGFIPIANWSDQKLNPEDTLKRDCNAIPNRGTKRRCSLENKDTPRSALDKCMRSKSPAHQKELLAVAASHLKPKIDDVFKVPQSTYGLKTNVSSFEKTGSSRYYTDNGSSLSKSSFISKSSSPSREYVSAASMQSPTEKLSLPNYGLVRPDLTVSSPSTSHRSGELSPGSQQGSLKRTVSQISNGSEFSEEALPLKVKKSRLKLSFPSVKLCQSATRSISIQNGSNKKLPLRVKIRGAGFSIPPCDDFRMIPLEARSFEVKFMPTSVGPVIGQLIFELATNNNVSKVITLYGYGGHSSIRIDGIHRGPMGPPFLTMGMMRMLNKPMEEQFRLTNLGDLPGFATLTFEKSKFNDFSLTESLSMSPEEVRLSPGESVEVTVRFKASKEEIHKIIGLGKEVATVGEIFLICGDEPTRLRVLKSSAALPQEILNFLPKKIEHDAALKRELVLFNENLDRSKLQLIIEKMKTQQISLTVNRSLDETQLIAADMSMADESIMDFETFVDSHSNDTMVEDSSKVIDSGYFESNYFRVKPSKVIFSRSLDVPDEPKLILVQSLYNRPMYAEAVSSRHEIVSAVKSCGLLQPGDTCQIKVIPSTKAFFTRPNAPLYVSVQINDAKVDVPVMFVD